MARLENQVEFIEATETIVDVDMGLVDLAFSDVVTHVSPQIEYDVRTIEGKTAKFTGFGETANIIEKDGKATVTLDAFTVNDKVPFGVLDLEGEKFGATKYDVDGSYASDPEVIGKKIHLGALLRRKKLAASVYAYGALIKARDGITADFNIPVGNFTVLALGKWNANGANPIKDIKDQIQKMKVKPTFVLMDEATWFNMTTFGDDVILNEVNGNTKQVKNIILNLEAGNEGTVRVAKIVSVGVMVDVYVSFDKDENDNAIFPDGYVGFANKRAGQFHFRGVPMRNSPDGMTSLHAGEWMPVEIHSTDPDVDAIGYRSGFLPVAKQNEAFGSIKAY